MNFKVNILADAENDIIDIYNYVLRNDSEEKAIYVLSKIEEKCLSLNKYPDRGHTPPELERVGIFQYKEIHFKSYRIIYEILESTVYIHCILDSRRSLQELLENRLFRS